MEASPRFAGHVVQAVDKLRCRRQWEQGFRADPHPVVVVAVPRRDHLSGLVDRDVCFLADVRGSVAHVYSSAS
jgi:hypothetical protein